MQKVKTYLQK